MNGPFLLIKEGAHRITEIYANVITFGIQNFLMRVCNIQHTCLAEFAHDLICNPSNFQNIYRQLRARRGLLQIKDVPLRTRRALLPLTLYSDSALLVLNGTSLSCNNTLLALN